MTATSSTIAGERAAATAAVCAMPCCCCLRDFWHSLAVAALCSLLASKGRPARPHFTAWLEAHRSSRRARFFVLPSLAAPMPLVALPSW
jgi:hypothetical protein